MKRLLKGLSPEKLSLWLGLFFTLMLFNSEAHAFARPVIGTINFIKTNGILIGIALGGLTFVYGVCTLFTPNPRWKLLLLCAVGVAILVGADEAIQSLSQRRG